MAGEIVGGMAANLDSGELFFAVQSKENWSFRADLGSGAFSDEAESRFSYPSCTVCEAVVLCAIFVPLKVCEFPRHPFRRPGFEEQVG